MLKDLFKPLLDMDERESLEFFQGYWKKRALDMLKAPTWEAKKEKKERVKKEKKDKKPRKKREKKISLNDLPPEVLELLKKAGGIK